MASHPIVHVEIPASDLTAAGAFYSELFGWEMTTYEGMSYTMFNPGSGPGGGFAELSDGFEVGQVLIHVETDDIEASLAKAESLGGTTRLPKTEIPGIGWYAIFTDPTGNSIGLYTGSDGQS